MVTASIGRYSRGGTGTGCSAAKQTKYILIKKSVSNRPLSFIHEQLGSHFMLHTGGGVFYTTAGHKKVG